MTVLIGVGGAYALAKVSPQTFPFLTLAVLRQEARIADAFGHETEMMKAAKELREVATRPTTWRSGPRNTFMVQAIEKVPIERALIAEYYDENGRGTYVLEMAVLRTGTPKYSV